MWRLITCVIIFLNLFRVLLYIPFWKWILFNNYYQQTSCNQLVIYSFYSKRMIQFEEFEDTKGVIRIRKSKKVRQHNDQTKKDIRTNSDLQNITHQFKNRVTRTPLKTGGELRCSGKVSSSCSTSDTRHVALVIEIAVYWVIVQHSRPHQQMTLICFDNLFYGEMLKCTDHTKWWG